MDDLKATEAANPVAVAVTSQPTTIKAKIINIWPRMIVVFGLIVTVGWVGCLSWLCLRLLGLI
jgi:hypothetical protein